MPGSSRTVRRRLGSFAMLTAAVASTGSPGAETVTPHWTLSAALVSALQCGMARVAPTSELAVQLPARLPLTCLWLETSDASHATTVTDDDEGTRSSDVVDIRQSRSLSASTELLLNAAAISTSAYASHSSFTRHSHPYQVGCYTNLSSSAGGLY